MGSIFPSINSRKLNAWVSLIWIINTNNYDTDNCDADNYNTDNYNLPVNSNNYNTDNYNLSVNSDNYNYLLNTMRDMPPMIENVTRGRVLRSVL